MSLYATLSDVRDELLAENTTDDRKVLRSLRQVSARVDEAFKRGPNLFVPTRAIRTVVISASDINSALRTLALHNPLLAFTAASVGTQDLTALTSLYPSSDLPAYALQLTADRGLSWYGYCANTSTITLTGVWGYHGDYPRAWLAVDTLAADLNDTATTLTVVDVDGENAYGDTPRLSAGALLQINEEWMDVTATDPATDTVTVRRGVNGSTAAAHLTGAAVSVFQVDESIRRMVIRQVAFQYARQGAFETRKVQDLTAIDYPADTLAEYRNLLDLFANM